MKTENLLLKVNNPLLSLPKIKKKHKKQQQHHQISKEMLWPHIIQTWLYQDDWLWPCDWEMSAGDHLDDDDANATKLIKTSKVGSDEKNGFLNFSFRFTFPVWSKSF